MEVIQDKVREFQEFYDWAHSVSGLYSLLCYYNENGVDDDDDSYCCCYCCHSKGLS